MSKEYRVIVADVARQDLRHLREYLVSTASIGTADTVIQRLLLKIETLNRFPERGSLPDELRELHIKHYRQTSVPPYRIVFKIDTNHVTILIVADGRRDFQKLLRDRLLR